MSFSRIFITGGTGFTGSHLARRFLGEGAEVHVTHRRGSSLERVKDIQNLLVLHEVDLADSHAVVSLLDVVKPDAVFHLGADLHQQGIEPLVEPLVRTNVLTTALALEWARKHDVVFVYAGTFSEYLPSSTPVRETAQLGPQEFYSLTKLAGTLRTSQMGKLGVPAVSLRIFTPYGPGMREGRLVRNAIERALAGEPIPLSSPQVTRDFIFVDDLVDLYIAAGNSARKFPGEVWNAGGGKATTQEEFSKLILGMTGSSSTIEWSTRGALAYDGELWQADLEKTKRMLGWSPAHDLRSGIEKTIAWYRKNTPRV
ncbi:MAG: hypothetical protein A3D65_01940 [Candidatus Lloydbacteria bacterium RIFCSPHIGHO2_02_FULL_50_13]|uniref:NAD-dependent epimerase/dehydratase domain-containing protein n=1 Tax=Candidatus Lloydbacteria bacterium RIFCSPHIGHO2_02_FULL_50_13 TaxID=1798661 RepID=A0A1G2D4X3_9BACT|nr:MAG: hypothetical protein A3D65_01940 [Candidatus Lloydbacteria bacterium RIFCSPHIGHO2_02_FULL_50_13]